jgi:hypothetical protein
MRMRERGKIHRHICDLCLLIIMLLSYVAVFQALGVCGVDILAADDPQLQQFGIDNPTHRNRVQIHISQLILQQNRIDQEIAEKTKEMKQKKIYFDMLEEYEALMAANTYQSPPLLKLWRTMDLFVFLKKKEHAQHAELFLENIAMRRLTGKELLEIISNKALVNPLIQICAYVSACFRFC